MTSLSRFTALYRNRPENARLLGTALLGASVGYVTYEVIYFFNPWQPRATTSWVLGFIIGVARQHALHRWLTFTEHPPYWTSLGRAYVMYTGSAVATTVLNWVLTEGLSVHHRLAWLICLLATALISLMFLKRYVFDVHTVIDERRRPS